MVEVIFVLKGATSKIAVNIADLAVKCWIPSVLSDRKPELLGVVVIDIVVGQCVVAIKPFDLDVGFGLNLRIAEVNEEPSDMVTFMLDVLENIPVSFSVEIGICEGREVKDTVLWSSQPHREGSVTKVINILFNSRLVKGQSKAKMPRLLVPNGVPLEPTTYTVFMREGSLPTSNFRDSWVLVSGS